MRQREKKVQVKKKSILFATFIFLFVLGFILKGANPLYMLSLLVMLIAIVESASSVHEHFALFFFLISFFFFLMGAEFIHVLFNTELDRGVTLEAEEHYYLAIFISLISLVTGYQIKIMKYCKEVQFHKEYYKKKSVRCVRLVAKMAFYVSYIIYVLPVIEKIIYVQTHSYYLSYVEYVSQLPTIFVKIGDVCPVAFAIFLSTFPNKKECKSAVVLYMIYAGLIFLTGKRYYTIAAIILLVTYYLIRNRYNTDGEKWISKKTIMLLLLSIPFVCVGLSIYSFVRADSSTYLSMSVVDLFTRFFEAVGDSDKVIKYGYKYKDLIPSDRIYSFGGIIDYFRCGYLAKLLTGSQLSVSQTVEYALEGNSFSHILSYLFFPNKYLKGQGLGSSYIAELFQDGGYIGLAMGNIVLGFLLRNMFKVKGNCIWKNALMFYVYSLLMRIPRGSFDLFIVEIFNIKFFVYFVGIFAVSNIFLMSNRRYDYEGE